MQEWLTTARVYGSLVAQPIVARLQEWFCQSRAWYKRLDEVKYVYNQYILIYRENREIWNQAR